MIGTDLLGDVVDKTFSRPIAVPFVNSDIENTTFSYHLAVHV